MKIGLYILFITTLLATGCSERNQQEMKAKQDADAKARADAAKKEMQTLPQTFKPRYNKKLDQSETKSEPAPPPPQNPKP